MERDPHSIYDELCVHKRGQWVVIDEVQRVPALLNEVHALIESSGLNFVLCGSSARKLRRSGTNLLAGRASIRHMFPLTFAELGTEYDMSAAIQFGTLHMAVTGADTLNYLMAYSSLYLNEEIRAEALTRSVGSFSRFLEVAARQNAQVTNLSNIARETSVSRSTVQNYFDILVDTLIGFWVHPWKLKRSTKQVGHGKFYLFDSGVARSLSGRLSYPPTPEESGSLLETLIFNEVRAYIEYSQLHYPVNFWRTYEGVEVDLLCETRFGFVGIEIKASQRWQRRYSRGLQRLCSEREMSNVSSYGIYLGERRMLIDDILILPAAEFLAMLWNGDILGA